ncbi:MAG: SET domain-containing protein-lysine N-methyltransferase [Planctomycetota bacterium]|nr:SET domain-containing protein-lysine N-methyltransferase [Planctomycetota bacterium]
MQMQSDTAAPRPYYPVGILRQDGRFHVLAGAFFLAGERIMELTGEASDRPSRYSVQVGWQEHVETWVPLEDDTSLDSCQVRYMNHSCRPNTRIVDRQVVALRDIGVREELTFDYNTTEWEMAESFPCECGHCGGQRIAGFKILSAEGRQSRANQLPEYLRSRMGQ